MFSFFKKKLIEQRKGKEVDYENSWIVAKFKDKEAFLKTFLKIIPDDSVWAVEGKFDHNLIDLLQKYRINDEQKVCKGTIWPKQQKMKVLINKESRKEFIEKLTFTNIEWNIIHQHFYKNNLFYLTSYDNLDEDCTRITNELTKSDIEILIKEGLIEID